MLKQIKSGPAVDESAVRAALLPTYSKLFGILLFAMMIPAFFATVALPMLQVDGLLTSSWVMIAALTLFPIVFVLIAAVIYLRAVSRLQRASEQSDNG